MFADNIGCSSRYLGHGEVEQGSMIGLAMLTKVRGKGEVDRSRTTMDQYETRYPIDLHTIHALTTSPVERRMMPLVVGMIDANGYLRIADRAQ
jgi:hypothetical protein